MWHAFYKFGGTGLNFATRSDSQVGTAETSLVFCHCERAHLYNLDGWNPVDIPWRRTSSEDYDEACERCEIKLTLSRADHARVLSRLRYNKTENGCRGRGLIEGVPELSLQAGDRLEPSPQLQDVGMFDTFVPDREIVFWRRAAESRTRHRNPLFGGITGVTHLHVCVDKLHTVYLGIAQSFCATVIWACINKRVFGDHTTQVAVTALHVLRIRQLLFQYYREQRALGNNLTQLENFTVGMIGTCNE